jgi:cytochrome c oxidase subunit II
LNVPAPGTGRATREERPLRGSSWARSVLRWALPALALALSGCAAETNLLRGRGPAAAEINTLWWFMFGVGLAIYLLVIVLALIAAVRGRRRREQDLPARLNERLFVIAGGIAMPTVVLLATLIFTVITGRAVVAREGTADLQIEVIGHQFWWEVRYPGQGFTTANEIHIPVGEPVEFKLRAADVIHSLWVPELHGKLDLMPGADHYITLEASEAGVYRGICAEFCGVQHAHMYFLVIAQPRDEWEAWVAQQQQPAVVDASLERGRDLYFRTGCASCHAIQGVTQSAITGTIAPDLTHLASRRTIGSGMVENVRGNLTQWVVNPHSIKSGVKMPSAILESEDLEALIDFLESLQ